MERVENKRGVEIRPCGDGFTLLLPAENFRTVFPGILLALVLVAGWVGGMITLSTKVIYASSWIEWWFWFGGLLVGLVLLRPINAFLSHRLNLPMTHGKMEVGSQELSVRWGVIWLGHHRRWDVKSLRAIDEDEGALCILSESGLERLFAGRDRDDLCCLASTLQRVLGVPGDVPGLEGEIAVNYQFAGWDHPRRGFVRITPGQLLLRPRFDLVTGLILRSGSAEEMTAFLHDAGHLCAGTVRINPADVSWGIGVGGIPVLRVWLQDHQAEEPVSLEITSPQFHDLRQAMRRFWEPS